MTTNKDPFKVKRELLNPKFESYKLAPSTSGAAQLVALPAPDAVLPAVPDHARFSYAEVQYRARHNHLSAGKGGDCLYVDAEGAVVAVELDERGSVHFHSLCEIPSAVSTSPGSASEYPAALSLTPSLWAISDGHGRLYTLCVNKATAPWTATITASFEHTSPDGALVPFRLHSVDVDAQNSVRAMLSLSVKVDAKPAAKVPGPGGAATPSVYRAKIESTTVFDWVAVHLGGLEALENGQQEAVRTWRETWRLRSAELPRFVRWDSSTSAYTFGAPTVPYSAATAPGSVASSPAIPSSAPPLSQPSIFTPASARLPAPPPYSWTQDTDSLTLAFPLPSDTPTSSIRLTFSPQYLTLHIGSASSALKNDILPHLSHAKLWAQIDAHSSLWTFDRDAEGRDSSYGLLSLHLEKAHSGTRWPSVFAPSSSSPGEGETLPEVPETMDPNELAGIVDQLEKYTEGDTATVGLDGEEVKEQEGMGGVPTSLRGDEMDVDVDGEAGTPFLVCQVNEEGVVKAQHAAFERALLSVSLPISGPSSETSVVLKHDVDGLAFTPPSASEMAQSLEWTHSATFPALAFVLATKTTTKFVYHFDSSSSSSSTSAVLAFDSPSSALPPGTKTASAGGNVFVYFRPNELKGTVSKQMVVRIGGPSSGALLGAVGVEVGGKRKLVVLLERELGVYDIF